MIFLKLVAKLIPTSHWQSMNDENGEVVKIDKTNDGKFRATVKIVRTIPNVFTWNINENYNGTQLNYSATFDILAKTSRGLGLPQQKIMRPVDISIITLTVPGYGNLFTSGAGMIDWTFTRDFLTEDEAKKYKSVIEGGSVEIKMDFAVKQKSIVDAAQSVVSFLDPLHVPLMPRHPMEIGHLLVVNFRG
jgi:hypothetical protein